ncbi:MAG: dihydroxyacetone kinase subunit L [Candidatus Nealsonbacteria bacterium]|nr:dihydroxyacetone kinase subunit L [Candidatus Nealsonbacteria bacterium]
MTTGLDYDGLASVFRAAAANVRSGVDRLCELDCATGDGDHGVAMGRAMDALEKGIDQCSTTSIQTMLEGVAESVESIDAGSTGPLMGSLMEGIAESVGDATRIDTRLLATIFEAGLDELLVISKAKVGDKTMVDALIPAVEALKVAAAGGESVADALAKAADAAEAGAEKTKQFQARFGRARNLGERSIGHQDPGATSMAMFFRGMAEGAASRENS